MAKHNFRRDIIRSFNLLSLLDAIEISTRNKEIISRYAAGSSSTLLAKEYGINCSRIGQIVDTFLYKCSRYCGRNLMSKQSASM